MYIPTLWLLVECPFLLVVTICCQFLKDHPQHGHLLHAAHCGRGLRRSAHRFAPSQCAQGGLASTSFNQWPVLWIMGFWIGGLDFALCHGGFPFGFPWDGSYDHICSVLSLAAGTSNQPWPCRVWGRNLGFTQMSWSGFPNKYLGYLDMVWQRGKPFRDR